LVFYSSAITMMHGPINISYVITFETAALCFDTICNSSCASLQVGICQ